MSSGAVNFFFTSERDTTYEAGNVPLSPFSSPSLRAGTSGRVGRRASRVGQSQMGNAWQVGVQKGACEREAQEHRDHFDFSASAFFDLCLSGWLASPTREGQPWPHHRAFALPPSRNMRYEEELPCIELGVGPMQAGTHAYEVGLDGPQVCVGMTPPAHTHILSRSERARAVRTWKRRLTTIRHRRRNR